MAYKPAEDEIKRIMWGLGILLFIVPVIAIFSGYFIASMGIGFALLAPIAIYSRTMSVPELSGLALSCIASFAFGCAFISTGEPGLTNDDRYQKQLSETAYSCQAAHYDRQNCEAQKNGLDFIATWLNHQRH